MRNYQKGYRAERELLHELYRRGWAAIRAPRSGRVGIPSPDLVAIRGGRVVVVECKSRAAAFTIEPDQIEQLKDWNARAGAEAYLGWRLSRKGWKFLSLEKLLMNGGRVGKKFIEENGISLDDLDRR